MERFKNIILHWFLLRVLLMGFPLLFLFAAKALHRLSEQLCDWLDDQLDDHLPSHIKRDEK